MGDDNIDAYGLELNNEAVKICLEGGLKVFNQLLEEHNNEHADSYNVVCSFQVLEHVPDPESFIQNCITAVKKGGKIIFGVPNNNPYIFKRDKLHTLNLPPHHMGLWSEKAFLNLPKYFAIRPLQILIEPLYLKKYYLKVFLENNKLGFLKIISNNLPDKLVTKVSNFRKWEGRNILAIFEKL